MALIPVLVSVRQNCCEFETSLGCIFSGKSYLVRFCLKEQKKNISFSPSFKLALLRDSVHRYGSNPSIEEVQKTGLWGSVSSLRYCTGIGKGEKISTIVRSQKLVHCGKSKSKPVFHTGLLHSDSRNMEPIDPISQQASQCSFSDSFYTINSLTNDYH